jgi:hypothetical protein
MHAPSLPPAIAEAARGRSHVTTAEAAHLLSRSPKTLRKEHSAKGEAYGIRPLKIGNTLAWPVDQIAALLRGEALK